jgi:amidase
MNALHFESAVEIARLIRERRMSAIDVLEHFLARVEKYNPTINAIIWMDAEKARRRARAADAAIAKGEVFGPLHGVPMTIKESYAVAGSPTTWGIPEFKNNVTEISALAVERLERASAIVFSKTNVPLMLADWQSYNAIYGPPWYRPDGHEEIRPQLVRRLHRRHHARIHAHYLRRLPRPLS